MKINWKDVYAEVNQHLRDFLTETETFDTSANKWTCGICGSGKHGHKDSTPALQLNDGGMTCHCYSGNCGFHGSLIDYYCKIKKMNPNDKEQAQAATIELAEKYGIQTPPVYISTRRHVYHDPNGEIISRKVINKDKDGKKYPYWQKYHPENNSYRGKTGTMKFLYDVQKIVGGTDAVYFAEGEKDAETIQKMGFTGTSTPNGAHQKKWLDTFNIGLDNRDIIILTDNDEAGEKYVNLIASKLANIAKSLKVIRPTDIYKDCKPKWDITDIADAIGIEATKTALAAAIETAPIYTPPTAPEEPAGETPLLPNKADSPRYIEKWDGDTLNEENFRRYLKAKGYRLRFNTISHKVEYQGVSGIASEHLGNMFPMIVYDDLHRELSRVNPKICGSYVNLIANKDEFNPILDIIASTEWDGEDHLETLYSIMKLPAEDKLSRTFMKKWLMQGYCLQYNTLENPISTEFVITLHGEQGLGKTTLLSKLAIKPDMFLEGHELNTADKDNIIKATAYFICELGEVGRTTKRDPNSLKAFITSAVDENRVPYAAASERHPRHTNFCATTNDERFLADITGNRRWGIIPLDGMDYHDVININTEEVLQIWAQIRHIVNEEIQNGSSYAGCFRLTPSERRAQELRNKRFLNLVTAQLEVEDILAKVAADPSDYEWKDETVTEWKKWHSCLDRYNVEKISHALTAVGINPPTKPTKRDGKTVKLRSLPFPKHKPGTQSIEMKTSKAAVEK